MITVKEYAKTRGVTIQAVHQQMGRKRNREKLVGHVQIIDGVKWIDEEAAQILDDSRKKSPIVIIDDQKDDLIEELRESLRRKEEYIAILEKAGIDKQNRLNQLEGEKILLEEKSRDRIDAAVMEAEERIRKELEEIYQANEQMLQAEYEKKILDLQNALESESSKTWWQKLWKK